MNYGVDQVTRSGTYLNIHICHIIRAAEGSVIRVGGRFIRHSPIGVREVGNLVPGVGNLVLAVEQLFGVTTGKEILQQTG